MRPLSRLAALSVLLLNACYPPGDGKAPPLDELYFPTGVALDGVSQSDADPALPGLKAPRYMYVANSDFDLQFRAASVISYDLDLLRKVVPRSCNTTADCAADGANAICDAPGVAGTVPHPDRGPSYYCVDASDPPPPHARTPSEPCGAFGERGDAEVVLTPGRCNWVEPMAPQDGTDPLLVDKVGIGAFATDVVWRKNPTMPPEPAPNDPTATLTSRLFIPVRGDSTLHWIEVTDQGKFSCGQENGDNDDGCDSLHRSGDVPSDNLDALRQPAEPFAIDTSPDADFVAITNQTSGTVSLYANDWRRDAGPKLASILPGLPLAPVGIAALPRSVLPDGSEQEPGFLVSYRSAAQIDLLRVHADDTYHNDKSGVDYTRYALRRAGSIPIYENSLGFDSRGIAIDDPARAACEGAFAACVAVPGSNSEACKAERTTCLSAVHEQSGVYVASRAPASLLVGAMTADVNYPDGSTWLPSFSASVPLTFGPSRVVMGDVKVLGKTKRDSAGGYDLERRVFVICFDSRRIFVYDPKQRVREAIVSTGRGPHALAVDGERGLAYLGHFTDSYLGVISLDKRFPKTYATIVASIGAPKAPRTSK